MTTDHPHPKDTWLGRRIRARREALMLTEKDLAERLCVSPQQVQRYECGSAGLTMTELYDIAAALEIELRGLLDLERFHPT